MQTLAEMWEHQGREKGERALLTPQLRRRFGELPASVLARIEQADEARLEAWGEALLDARSLDELFPTS